MWGPRYNMKVWRPVPSPTLGQIYLDHNVHIWQFTILRSRAMQLKDTLNEIGVEKTCLELPIPPTRGTRWGTWRARYVGLRWWQTWIQWSNVDKNTYFSKCSTDSVCDPGTVCNKTYTPEHLKFSQVLKYLGSPIKTPKRTRTAVWLIKYLGETWGTQCLLNNHYSKCQPSPFPQGDYCFNESIMQHSQRQSPQHLNQNY